MFYQKGSRKKSPQLAIKLIPLRVHSPYAGTQVLHPYRERNSPLATQTRRRHTILNVLSDSSKIGIGSETL